MSFPLAGESNGADVAPGRGRAGRRVGEGMVLLVVLLAFAALMLAGVRDKSTTADEVLHAAGGYTYWMLGDYRLQAENSGNGILPQRWYALPLLGDRYRFPPPTAPGWRTGDGFRVGDEWFHRMGNDAVEMLRRGRWMAVAFPVIVGGFVWLYSRRLFGPRAGWVSLGLCVLNPTILANGPLMASDVAAALFFLIASWTWWRMLHHFTIGRVIGSAAATAGLFLSKSSAPIFVLCVVAQLAIRMFDGRPLPIGRRQIATGRKSLAGWFGAAVILHAFVVWVSIWGFYGFRYACCRDRDAEASTAAALWNGLMRKTLVDAVDELDLPRATRNAAMRVVDRYVASVDESDEAAARAITELKTTVLDPEQSRALDERMADPVLREKPARAIAWARTQQLLPEAYLLAYLHMGHNSRARRSFLNGEFSALGRPWFFPYTFLVKTPIATFILLLLAAGAAVASVRRATTLRQIAGLCYLTAPLWILISVYLAVAVTARINIGHRHLLPLYPPLFVLGGMAAVWLPRRGSNALTAVGVAVPLLLLAQLAEVAWRFPNFLAYFNGIVSPRDAYRHLVDSSLDWGQELPGVRQYQEQHAGAAPFYLSYFGAGDPAAYGIRARYLPSTPGLFMRDRPTLLAPNVPPGGSDLIAAMAASYPEYEMLGLDETAEQWRIVLMKKPEEVRLTAGTYFIGAMMLQTPWDASAEATYQRLQDVVLPFLGSDVETRRANIVRSGVERWQSAIESWEIARFARLVTYLRAREPDDNIGYSILVYHVTDAEIARALTSPLPPARR